MPRKIVKKTPHKPKVPKWVADYFRSCLDANETLFRIIHLSQSGIGVIRAMPRAVKVIADVEGSGDEPDTKRKIERAESEARLAQTEIATDFPVLHGLAVVASWSWLEHFVKGLAAIWLLNRKDALAVPAVQKLKMKLGDYLQLSKVEQAAYLVDLLEQDISSPLKRGINRFESILEPFSLSGSVSDECSRALFELQQVRNAVAHRNGHADRRLRQECPWLKVRLNQPVLVSNEMLKKYSNASVEYLVTVLYRVGDLYGKDLRPTENELPNPALQGTPAGKPAAPLS